MMTKQTAAGAGLIIGAIALMLFNISDTIADLSDWHAASTPQFVAAVAKQIAAVLMGAVGGANLPQLGKGDAP